MSMRSDSRIPVPGFDMSYGATSKKHLDGAVLRLVRDADASSPHLIVMSREDLTAELYVIGRQLMLTDVRLVPIPKGRRTVTMFCDQRVLIDDGGESRATNVRITVANISPEIMPALLERDAYGKVIHVEGIGPVKLLIDGKEEREKRGL